MASRQRVLGAKADLVTELGTEQTQQQLMPVAGVDEDQTFIVVHEILANLGKLRRVALEAIPACIEQIPCESAR